jgi:rhamnosyltransferase
MNSLPKIGGCVILYHPPAETVTNILSYIDQIDKLLVFDNSEEDSTKLLDILLQDKKITYFTSRKNFGIGFALNYAAKKFSADGYDFLLTMDQDSKAPPDLVQSLLEVAQENANAGIISPFHSNKFIRRLRTSKETKHVMTTMTSGNLLSLAAYNSIGPFREDFFIDYIDIEFCLRLNNCGYKVIQLNNVILEHNLGEIVKRKFLFRRALITNHSPLRIYYRTRNRLFVLKKFKLKYPLFCIIDVYNFMKETTKIILYEYRRFEKLRMITRGLVDYRKKILGKYCSNYK